MIAYSDESATKKHDDHAMIAVQSLMVLEVAMLRMEY